MKKVISMLLMAVMIIGMIPTVNVQAATDKIDAGYYYVAKGETVTFKNTHKGKLSIVSKAGNTVKISGNKIKVTAKKSGSIVVKSGKKEIAFEILIGGNNKDTKANYAEYNIDLTDGKKSYSNYIDCIRYRIKKKKSLTYVTWEDKKDNKEIKKLNRGIYIGESIFDVNDVYPSWCDYGGWTEDNGDEYLSTYCAMYYDKKSNCVFYKFIYGLQENEVISGVEWGCWKNNSRVFSI